jgi:hypothetical protein
VGDESRPRMPLDPFLFGDAEFVVRHHKLSVSL